MTQVWLYRNSDTDIQLFAREALLLPTVQTTYSRCEDVEITDGMRDVSFKERIKRADQRVFKVTGKRNGKAFTEFTEFVVFSRYPVWTEPSHL